MKVEKLKGLGIDFGRAKLEESRWRLDGVDSSNQKEKCRAVWKREANQDADTTEERDRNGSQKIECGGDENNGEDWVASE